MTNTVADLLVSLGIVCPPQVSKFHPRVRDRDDIQVMRCARSGVIFLSRSDHMDLAYYEDKRVTPEVVIGSQIQAPPPLADDRRRAEQIRELVTGRLWLDIGTGAGGILDLLDGAVASCVAIEPNETQRTLAASRQHAVYRSLEELPSSRFDVVTLFHVFEHLLDPVSMLSDIRSRLMPGGQVVIEVPHARDFLIATLRCKPFMDFTFWSEHLVLHTRESLEAMLRHSGFNHVTITGYQRYPVSNHLFWLARDRPGGHQEWHFLNSAALEDSYADILSRLDQTDTLIAYATP